MRGVIARLVERFRRRQLDRDLDDELAAHLEFSEADHVARGLSDADARRAARLALGGSSQVADAVQDVRGLWLDHLWRDAGYALRQLRRAPGFTLVAVLSLGVGAGATLTIFGFASALLFKPLAAREPGSLIRVMGQGGDTSLALLTESDAHIPAQDFFHYRDENQTFSALAAHFIGGPERIRLDGPARVIPVTLVSGNYFETLGVEAALGRALVSADGRSPARNAVVLSDIGWRRFFDADPAVVGRTLLAEGRPATIVGVLPASFTGANAPMVPQIYAPILEVPATTYHLDLIGRMKPGVTPAQAAADLTRIARQLTAVDRRSRTIEAFEPSMLMPPARRAILLVSSMFLVIVSVVLLIACDNVAILLLTRSARRRREIAVRLALGASRSRLLAQLLTESLLLCAGGGLAGLFVANATARFLTQFYVPVPMPFALTYDLDWRVIAFMLALVSVTTLLCGIAPAMQSINADVSSALRASSAGNQSRVRASLIVTQVTLSTTLLVTGVVLARSLAAPVAPESGFTSRGVLMTTIGLESGYTPARRAALIRAIIDRLEHTPGVSSVTAADNVPLTNNRLIALSAMHANGHDGPVYSNSVAPSFLETLGIPLVAGREFTSRDDPASPAVGIVNETLARRFWPGEPALGKQLRTADGKSVDVVGVARDAKYELAQEEPKAFLYRPMAQVDVTAPTLLLRITGDPSGMFPLIRSRIAELDPELAPFNLMTLDDRLSLGLLLNRGVATVAGGMGLLALALSMMGIYGTMAFLGQQRRREIGVRLALGASNRKLISLMTQQGMAWAGIGLAIGLTAGLAATLLLRSLLRGITVADPLAFILTPFVLAAVAYAACYVPARGAIRVDPLVALREE